MGDEHEWRRPRTEKSVRKALKLLRLGDRLDDAPACGRFDVFVHLVRGDTLARSLALLDDRGPVVRSYAAECILQEHPEHAARVEPLLFDAARLIVNVYDGLRVTTVGEHVLGLVRFHRRHPTVARLFDRAVAAGLCKPFSRR